MSAVQNITVDTIDSGSRLDRWFKKRFPHVPHGKVEKLLRTGQLRVDGKRSKGNLRVEGGQVIRIPPLPDPSKLKFKNPVSPKEADFLRSIVIYEDSDLIALNKPHGIAVQGGTGTSSHIDGMLPALGEGCRLVHRLDRDTSGVLIIAKNLSAAKSINTALPIEKRIIISPESTINHSSDIPNVSSNSWTARRATSLLEIPCTKTEPSGSITSVACGFS